MKRRRVRVLLIATLAAIAAVLAIAWRLRPRESIFLTDGDSIRELASSASVRQILWEPPVPLDRRLSISADLRTPTDIYEPCVSRDGATLFFVRGRAGRNADIFFCRRGFEGWSDPGPIEAVNSEYDDLGPHPSPDGKTLYFYSDRPGGRGGYDLWCSTLVDDRWTPPVDLGPQVNSEYNEYGPAPSPDGKLLYFASNRPRPNERAAPQAGRWSATLREDLAHHDYDLYQARVEGAEAGEAEPLSELNTTANEGAPCLSPFGDFLYFGSDRPGGFGGFDLYRARRAGGRFEHPTNLGSAVNSRSNELDPALALGGFGLYFSSDRRPADSASSARAEYKLYYTASREVFQDVVVFRPALDWWSIWRLLGPNLLWALVALLAMLLLFAGFRDARRRQLGLLARCLLFSLFIHLLLMLLFNVWRVGSALAHELGRPGSIQVALTASASDALADQIRGNLTQVDPLDPSAAPLQRSSAAIQPLEPAPRLSTSPPRAELAERSLERPIVAQDASVSRSRQPEFAGTRLVPAAGPSIDVHAPPSPSQVAQSEADRPAAAPQSASRSEHAALVAATQPNQPIELAPATTAPPPDRTLVALIPPLDATPGRRTPGGSSPAPSIPQQVAPPDFATPPEPPRSTAAEAVPELHPSAARARPVRVEDRIDSAPLARLDPAPPSPSVAANADQSITARPASAMADSTPPSPVPEAGAVHMPPLAAFAAALPPMPEPPPRGTSARHASMPQARPAAMQRTVDAAAELPLPPSRSFAYGARATVPVRGDESLVKLVARDGAIPERATREPPSAPLGEATPPFDTLARSLHLPTEQLAPENPYVQRVPEQREDLVRRMGGSDRTEAAVSRALKWLAAHQSSDGRWSSTRFDEQCGECGGAAQVEADVAMTGLSVLCFLGADHTHMQTGPYRDNVRRAIRWLCKRQDADGDLRDGESMYSHGIATIALAEAYGMTHDEQLHSAVRRAADFIWSARNRRGAGWRYEPGQYGDTSVLGWQVMALRSAQRAGIDVPDAAFDMAQRWLRRVSSRSSPGLFAYQPGRAVTPSMTAEGMFVLQITGVARDDERMDGASALLIRNRPDWDGGANTYYWYYATLALFQRQGEEWPRWNRRLVRELLAHQEERGPAAGSWDPEGEWAPAGGRVYQTALCTLMLEVYYRYLPMYGEAAPKHPASDR